MEKTNEKEVSEILVTKSMEPKRPESLKLCVVNKDSDPEFQIHKFTSEGSMLIWRGKCNRETADKTLAKWYELYTTRHK